jgi:hypothetical protein
MSTASFFALRRGVGLCRGAGLALAMGLTSALFAQPCAADPRADELKKQGDAAMDTLHYDEAIAAYSEAYGISHNPALLYNRGRVYQARGEYPAALADIERFDHDATPELRGRVPKLEALLAELRAKVATVTISSKTPGARVVIRERVVGVTPLPEPVKLNEGKASIDVTKEGFFPFHKDVVLPKGGSITVEVALDAKSTRGQLIAASQEGASIFVDGKALGGPRVETMLEPGAHKVAARKDGFEESVTSVVIVAGERKELSLDLKKSPSIASRWWFWGGIGAVVTGGVIAVIVLRPEKSPNAGDKFTPGNVTAALVRW